MTDSEPPLDPSRYAPFKIEDARDTKWNDIRVSFSEWDWLREQYGSHEIDGYYLNGYGVEGLVKALLLRQGMNPSDPDIHWNSEGGTCYIQFKSLDRAVRVAELAAQMIRNRQQLEAMIAVAREHGFEDG